MEYILLLKEYNRNRKKKLEWIEIQSAINLTDQTFEFQKKIERIDYF